LPPAGGHLGLGFRRGKPEIQTAADKEVVAAGKKRPDSFDELTANWRIRPGPQMRVGVKPDNDTVGRRETWNRPDDLPIEIASRLPAKWPNLVHPIFVLKLPAITYPMGDDHRCPHGVTGAGRVRVWAHGFA
jgi:hypothetical protein